MTLDPRREWRAPRLSGPQVYYLVTLALGLVGIAECVVLLASHAAGHVSGATFAGFFGGIFALCALGLLLVPARRVERLADGSYRFVSLFRSLRVAPGELVSIRCLVPDPSRLWPMRVTARSGRILLAPRIDDIGDLCRELGAQNPLAGITDPDPFSKRFDRPMDE
ncbi:MAG TPA: hypothetical protein VGS61_06415 [Acidimicrobiales bacterium]|nr:hypothetical protein [Acidimicrobiales bacterium]